MSKRKPDMATVRRYGEGVMELTAEQRLAFAKVGLRALIDEATGYQDKRPASDLRNALAEYLPEAPDG